MWLSELPQSCYDTTKDMSDLNKLNNLYATSKDGKSIPAKQKLLKVSFWCNALLKPLSSLKLLMAFD